MEKRLDLTIAFDIDGTLIDFNDKPRKEIIWLLMSLSRDGHEIILWSGGGIQYAEMWMRRLKLEKYVDHVVPKLKDRLSPQADIAFDDEEVDLAKINICIGEKEGN